MTMCYNPLAIDFRLFTNLNLKIYKFVRKKILPYKIVVGVTDNVYTLLTSYELLTINLY